jgi:hypothetical protein
MTTNHIHTVMVPPAVCAPRGAAWAAALAIGLARTGRAMWQALEQTGQRRAARELRDVAHRWRDIDPELARLLHQARLSSAARDVRAGAR